jgi:hypothetical protein
MSNRPWEEDGKCLRRAIRAGLLYSGIDDDCEWVTTTKDIHLSKLVEAYPELGWIGRNKAEEFTSLNEPYLVVYKPIRPTLDEDGKEANHAVFICDYGPFCDFEVYAVIRGWEDLRERIKRSLENGDFGS